MKLLPEREWGQMIPGLDRMQFVRNASEDTSFLARICEGQVNR